MKTILLFLILCAFKASSQPGPASNWYFGTNAGITFNSGSPIALTNGALTTTEGVATISDNLGALLFYTNGITVWNRNHLVMTNGTGLNGDISSTQSSIIVKKPASANIYYIFTSDADAGPNGIQWSEVNMSLSAGLGSVTANKNISLLGPNQLSCEKLCAVRNCNNEDIWIITKDWNSNVFRCWSISSLMVGNILTWSSSGIVASGIVQGAYGQLKASPDGTKLLACYYGFAGNGINKVELYDFDTNTGIVSNSKTISTEIGAYGCEFSPNGQIIYASTNIGALIQWNISSNNLPTIQSTRTVIYSNGLQMGSLQIAPDNKIYVSRNNTSLSVINFPNSPGVACGYVNLSINLAGRNSRFGLPNFAPSSIPVTIGPVLHN